MGQLYKNVYFPDYPSESTRSKNITLAFRESDKPFYEKVKSLSSQQLREHIGHSSYHTLIKESQVQNLPLNTLCLRLLRQTILPKTDYASNDGFIHPLQTTFKGGHEEPMHRWFPYLEGYSPKFVEQIIKDIVPSAKTVLDPFGGTGTTVLTASKYMLQSYYCEVNPLLQFLVGVKFEAATISEVNKRKLLKDIERVILSLNKLIAGSTPDRDLLTTYENTFGESVFFDNKTFEKVLRVRGLIDNISHNNDILGDFLNVATLASLIPASRLIRRGDIRYKTPSEMENNSIDFVEHIKNQLSLMAADLRQNQKMKLRPQLLCSNARNLINIQSKEIDAVITSPPYLNGTNYFRNTKIELWFLRYLKESKDLSNLRFEAITAGINDVTNAKRSHEIPESAKSTVEALENSAYDIRIPRMATSYFSEMGTVLKGLKTQLSKGGRVVIDIGDSAYGNVHVKTDQILKEIAQELGFSVNQEILLRKRLSRGGLALKQVLLVFEQPKTSVTRSSGKTTGNRGWEKAWNKFKAELPHQKHPYCKRNWGHPLHSLCSYQGKMKPSLAHHLVKTFVPQGGSMLDPFGGVGTIPFEAALSGIKSWSFEISPAAFNIATAKLGIPFREDCVSCIRNLEEFIKTGTVTSSELEMAQNIRFNGALSEYFPEQTFQEILLARRYFLRQPPKNASESLVLASLLHILHGNRPYALSRCSHPITPFAPTGSYKYRPLIPRLFEKVWRSLEVVKDDYFEAGKVLFQDATQTWPKEICELDAIITSPPFFDSTRFYSANWMRLWFSGWEALDFQTRPGSFVDEKQKLGFQIYEPILRQARERLKRDGVFVLHLGKSKKCDMAAELSKMAAPWFSVADIFNETVAHCESHGIRDKGTVTEHQYLILT